MKYLLYLVLMTTLVVAQDLKLTNAFIKQNGTMKVGSQSAVVMSASFENRSNKRADVDLVFFNSSYPLNTWSYKFSLAPKSHSIRDFPFKLDANCREMQLQLKQGGRQINQVKVKVFSQNVETILILDDLLDTNYLKSSFFKSSQRVVNTVATVPTNWVALKNVDLFIINNPPKAQLSKSALQVISQYVHNGGSILFTHPESINHIYDLGYGDLLPAQFLSLTKKNKSRLMLKKAYANLIEPQGFDFMQVKLFEDSYVMLKDQNDPLVASRAVGLGLSFFYAIPLAQESLASHSKDMAEFMKFFTNYSRRLVLPSDKGDSSLERYTSSMSGMVAPKSSGLFMILLIYGACVFAIFVLARILKKVQYSWALVATVSIAFSLYLISSKDKMINVPSSSKNLQLEYAHLVRDGLQEGVFSLYEIEAGNLDFNAKMGESRLLSLSTYEKAKAPGSRMMSVTSTNKNQKTEVDIQGLSVNFLNIGADKEKISLSGTEVEAETWRSFAEWTLPTLDNIEKPLTITLDESGVNSKNHDIEAVLLGNNGSILLGDNDFNEAIVEPLLKGLGRTQVVLYKNKLNDDGKGRITARPVVLKAKSKKVLVPSEFVGIAFTDFQNLWDINRNMITKTATGGIYRCGFRLQVPVELSGLKVKDLMLKFKIDSSFPAKISLIEGKKRKAFNGDELNYSLQKARDINELYFDMEIAFESKSGLQTIKEFTLKEFNISLKGELP
ncbi:hypothetical protein PQO01_10705 [Lentisphaera marina]|uniref:DUF7408 domain-containing protein n=1 Tax=Lentisphaera marina TaxID=1111041 RepID=UPI002366ACBF|nr:hypothetical protein [Lentisphaera marina]MDD7985419.1 hypothetical protein [Lentisphaera marina]